MKDKRFFKPLDKNIAELIPQREIVEAKTKNFENSDKITNNQYLPTDYSDLFEMVDKGNKDFFASQKDCSRFSYISHQKRDGILAAKGLYEYLCADGAAAPVYNPRVEEKSIASYIKSPRLKNKALEYGYIERERIPLWNTILSVFSGVLLFFTTIKDFLELFNFTGDFVLSEVVPGFKISLILTLFLVAVFAGSICLAVVQGYKNKKNQMIQLNKKLAELDDDDFLEFMSEFSGDEFYIPDCSKDDRIFICVLQNYSLKEKHILRLFWCNASTKQHWWIFAEGTNENKVFVVPHSKHCERRFYYQKWLENVEKKKIATAAYAGKVNFTPGDDSGTCIFGADYLCRFHLKERNPVVGAKQINEKISRFCNEYKVSYHCDIKLMIHLIADLSCTYGVDFTNRKNWEYLFNYNQGDKLLNELDKQVTDALVLDNRTFKNLIPAIISDFSGELEDIVAAYPNSEQTSEYEQWCIIKALKIKSSNNEDYYMAICDTLMMEFASCEDMPDCIYSSKIWKAILVKAAEIFYKNQFFWFLPTLINKLIYFFDGKTDSSNKLFSESAVLKVACANLLLGINFESEHNYSYSRIDLIRDHYKVVCAAATELKADINLDANSSVSPSFELLQFTQQERRRYYNALHFLKEEVVIEFLNYLFDMFCIVISTQTNHTKFCHSVIYENSLYDKYIKRTNISVPANEDYIRIISLKMLDLLNNNFGAELSYISDSINELKQCLSNDVIESIPLLIGEFDVLGFNTLTFISCLFGRATKFKRLSQDIYLNLGSYLLGVVFLTYYECSKDSFLNEDFKYLVDICTSYEEPGGAVLGFMCYCDTVRKPPASGERITQYVKSNKANYLENFIKLASCIDYNDIEEFFSFIYTLRFISDEEKNEIYENLESFIKTNYVSHPKSYLYLELISLYLNGKPTPDFENDTPRNNIEKILASGLSANIVYLFYDKCIDFNEAEYSKLCYLVAPEILKASLIRKTTLLIYCLLCNTDSANSEEFAGAVRLVYEFLSDNKLDLRLSGIRYCLKFLSEILGFLENEPNLYEWTTHDEIYLQQEKLKVRMAEIADIQAQEFCALRTWNNYGIAIYLREILQSSFYAWYCPDDYKDLDKDQKIKYIVDNFKKLQHIVVLDGKIQVNKPYIDMVTSFINNDGDIQHRLNENECMHKLTSGLIEIVKNYKILSEASKERVIRLVSEYIKHMG